MHYIKYKRNNSCFWFKLYVSPEGIPIVSGRVYHCQHLGMWELGIINLHK